jgi:hypothetical protein
MASTWLRTEERIGLIVALAAHVVLVALLVIRPPSPPPLPVPERIAVTLSDEVGLTSTSPEPMADAAPDLAPEIGEQPEPQPVAQPTPPPAPRATPSPVPRPSPRALASPAPRPSPTQAARAAPRPTATPTARPSARPGGSRIGSDFLRGAQGAQSSGAAQSPPAATIGPAIQSALAGAISRQLKPHWAAPQGADAEKLVTVLAWSLNPDGSLAGSPRVVAQQGITEANRPQAARHAEQAIRAVQLAAPFELPSQYYSAWRRVASFRFDKRLAQ